MEGEGKPPLQRSDTGCGSYFLHLDVTGQAGKAASELRTAGRVQARIFTAQVREGHLQQQDLMLSQQ